MSRFAGNLLEVMNGLKPWQVRILAYRKTVKQIAEDAGLKYWRAQRISRAEKWDEFVLSEIVAFTRACGVDLLHQQRPMQNLNRMFLKGKPPPRAFTRYQNYWMSLIEGNRKWRQKSQ